MENSPKPQENNYPFLIPSPNTHRTITSNSNNSNNGVSPSLPVKRSESNNPYPTTFIQADTSSFKQVVQLLTGSSEPTKRPDPLKNPIPPVKTGPKKQKSSKLYERVNSLKNFKLSPLVPGPADNITGLTRISGTQEVLSPSLLDFPGLVLSPVTPLIPDPFNRSPNSDVSPNMEMEGEKMAIVEKGFYLHPSPVDTPRDSEPRLLPLFPLTSPKVSGSSNSSS
ncbi:hypothetical protein LguiB_034071 [Lonicera macranthoides]